MSTILYCPYQRRLYADSLSITGGMIDSRNYPKLSLRIIKTIHETQPCLIGGAGTEPLSEMLLLYFEGNFSNRPQFPDEASAEFLILSPSCELYYYSNPCDQPYKIPNQQDYHGAGSGGGTARDTARLLLRLNSDYNHSTVALTAMQQAAHIDPYTGGDFVSIGYPEPNSSVGAFSLAKTSFPTDYLKPLNYP